jgi:hypothetical protein
MDRDVAQSNIKAALLVAALALAVLGLTFFGAILYIG